MAEALWRVEGAGHSSDSRYLAENVGGRGFPARRAKHETYLDEKKRTLEIAGPHLVTSHLCRCELQTRRDGNESGGTDPMEFPYKVAMEDFLETGIRAQGNSRVKVTIADDGETATVQIADKYTQYRLSPKC
jgi:hypothetical protein